MHVTHVWCDTGNGKQLGHIVGTAHENADGETKSTVWVADRAYEMGYREPSDPNNTDPSNTGLTFWSIVDEGGND
jgi:hypothetical protein